MTEVSLAERGVDTDNDSSVEALHCEDHLAAVSAACIEPVTPQFSGERLRHAEEGRRSFNRQCGYGERHHACRR